MSEYIKSIIEKNNNLAYLQVVFIDIEKYSLRRTSSQVLLINEFTRVLNETINELAQETIVFSQDNNINFRNDIIIIPTGDGAAVVFPFQGVHNLHIKFAEKLLKNIHALNEKSEICDKFTENGWCNCHTKFNLRIGISEGKSIIYKDVNGHYNVAGNVINIASRLTSEANRNQIILSEEAYKQLIDLEDDPNYQDNFFIVNNVNIKHNIVINIYIYNPDLEYINGHLSAKYLLRDKMELLKKSAKGSMELLDIFDDKKDKSLLFGNMSEMLKLMGELTSMQEGHKVIKLKPTNPDN